MTKNIEDLLYRGDSLERMGDMSQRLREDSKKYRKAAVRINWELLLKQVSYQRCSPFLIHQDLITDPYTVRAIWGAGVDHHSVHLVAVFLIPLLHLLFAFRTRLLVLLVSTQYSLE